MRQIFFILPFIALMASCSEAQHSTENTIAVLSAEEFKKGLSGDVQIIDVRTPEEYSDGAIEGAVNINFFDADFDTRIGALDKNKPVYVYCAAGGRSAKASKKFQSLGFKTIYDLKGGYNAWSKVE